MHALSEHSDLSELAVFILEALALALLNYEELLANVAFMEHKIALLVFLGAQSVNQAHLLCDFEVPKKVDLIQVVQID